MFKMAQKNKETSDGVIKGRPTVFHSTQILNTIKLDVFFAPCLSVIRLRIHKDRCKKHSWI